LAFGVGTVIALFALGAATSVAGTVLSAFALRKNWFRELYVTAIVVSGTCVLGLPFGLMLLIGWE
jgi:sulfite exporter TauE/SafE